MTDVPITFPDPRRAVRDILRDALAGRPESFASGVTVSTKPVPGGTGTRPVPWIQVRSDGRFRDSRLNGRATIRVLVWHADEGSGEDLAGLAEALLLAASSTDVRGFSPVAGPIPSFDEEEGLDLSFFTITARLRPRSIT